MRDRFVRGGWAVSPVVASPRRDGLPRPRGGAVSRYGRTGCGRGRSGSWCQYVLAVVGAVVLAVVGAVVASGSVASAAPPGRPVLSWGDNTYGQLGNATRTGRTAPGPTSLPESVAVTDVRAGLAHALALTSTGQVYSWGRNNYGQLGDGTNTDRDTPVVVAMPSGTVVTAVAAGHWHSLALTSTGDVYAWGLANANYGNTPTQVTFPSGVTVTAVAGGNQFDLALTSTGDVYTWGRNNYGQLGDGTTTDRATPGLVSLPSGATVMTIANGYGHAYALTSTGAVYAWGQGVYGGLGDGGTSNRSTPVQTQFPAGVTPIAIASGEDHGLAVTSTGEVFAWGKNTFGQVGDGTTTNRTRPVQAALPTAATATAVISAPGAFISLALTTSGEVLAWGRNTSGQLGDGTTTSRATPVQVPMPAAAILTGGLTAGATFTLAVVSYSAALGWGANNAGQLGDGTTVERRTPVDVTFPSGMVLAGITAGYSHSLAVDDVGVTYAWGANAQGQLGTGDTTAQDSPVPVSGFPTGTRIVAVTAGQFHSVALAEDGTVYAWGYNSQGQLGDGTTTQRLTPVEVTGFPAGTVVTAISSHNVHNIAVTSTGDVYTWGDNSSGQIGNGTTTIQTSAVQIPLPNGGIAVNATAGALHTVAVTDDGSAYAWGYNLYGQLGDGTTTNAHTPVQVQTTDILVDADAGGNHTLAITDNGGAVAWGLGSNGQIGNGTTTTNSTTPVTVNLPTGVTVNAVDGGRAHSLAVVNISTDPAYPAGQVLAWGYNNHGQLGDSTTTQRTSPVKVHQPAGSVAGDVVAGGQYHSLTRLTY